ncbi:hypothetical protein [Planococcus sp. 107-1]|uniref:hypothetical protein n=1 Tax=Planococcus sp. 107-1 TaxID=2908840 RepID=UPI001F40DEB5|nr:hypothetical protein [Planococcus sp. 107-1]UJF26687.1 hypothetical protein L0M13_16355 [Planococcus sp. 107-1]
MDIKNELEKANRDIRLSEKEKSSIRSRAFRAKKTNFHLKPAFITVLFLLTLVVLSLPYLPLVNIGESAASPVNVYPEKPISKEQKESYYEEYTKIVEQAMDLKSGIGISLAPMQEFKETDWVAPIEFKKDIDEMVESHLATEADLIAKRESELYSAKTDRYGETRKNVFIYVPDFLKELEVTAHFDTRYSSDDNRQVFEDVASVSTAIKSPTGEWKQTSYEAAIIDGGQKYVIDIEGTFTLNGLSYEKAFAIEFTCDEFGQIS